MLTQMPRRQRVPGRVLTVITEGTPEGQHDGVTLVGRALEENARDKLAVTRT